MIEPVAYVQIRDGKAYSVLRKGTPNDEYTPVYTAEQLLPRVKMTREQKQLMMSYKNNKESFFILLSRTRQLINNPFEFISEEELMSAWLNPEETIEIVPEMKWFVRSKTSDEKYGYWYLHKTEHYFFHEYIKELSTQFDTKEEAEEWTNPLTEAVQLPVEE